MVGICDVLDIKMVSCDLLREYVGDRCILIGILKWLIEKISIL